jgi:hypothetical protein
LHTPTTRQDTTDLPSLSGEVSDDEWQARVEACYRLVDKYGMTDLI